MVATQNWIECQLKKKLVHHLIGSLEYLPRNEKTIKCSMVMDMPPAQIFTYKGQHPPMSRTIDLSLNAHSSAKKLREAHEHEPETADAV